MQFYQLLLWFMFGTGCFAGVCIWLDGVFAKWERSAERW